MTTSATDTPRMWSNWSGIHTCAPRRWESVSSEMEIQSAVTRAAAEGSCVRPTGAQHSFSPLVVTDDVIMDVQIPGDVRVHDRYVTVPAGQRLKEFLDPVWEQGLALRNMGELDSTALSGAIATGVHGTGLELPSISASVRAIRLVQADGTVWEISDDIDRHLFRAAKQSLGLLGVVSEATIEMEPAYDLVEESFFLKAAEAVERWDELLFGNRHFSFFFLPRPEAAHTYANLVPPLPDDLSEACYATVRNPVSPNADTPQPKPGGRRGRVHHVLAYEYETRYREIEFAVPLDEGKTVFRKMCDLVRSTFPDFAQPMDIRFVAQDDALLSWAHDGPQAVFSVPGSITEGFAPVLEAMQELFTNHGGRPHWGKEHTLTPDRVLARQPALADFIDVRRELDPHGVFLNPYLSPYFT